VLDALLAKAEKGDVPAARELRGWYDQGLGKPEGVSLNTGDVDTPYQGHDPRGACALARRSFKRIGELEAQADALGGEAEA
jgi:hypothetical protein